MEFAMLHHVSQNSQAKTLARDRAFHVVMAFDGHRRNLHTFPKGVCEDPDEETEDRCV